MLQEIIDIVDEYKKTHLPKYFGAVRYQFSSQQLDFIALAQGEKLLQKIYNLIYYNGMMPICENCNKINDTFTSFSTGYNVGCCNICTNMIKYGVENPTQCPEIYAKQKKTMIDRYGVPHSFQDPGILEKRNNNMIDQYGTTHALQNDIFMKKKNETMVDRYKVEYAMQNAELCSRYNASILEKYNVSHVMHNVEILEKFKESRKKISDEVALKIAKTRKDNFVNRTETDYNIKLLSPYIGTHDRKNNATSEVKYTFGCNTCQTQFVTIITNPKCPICYKKNNVSKGETDLYNYIQSLIPDVEIVRNDRTILVPKELDIYIPSLKLAFEYNGNYYHKQKPDGYHEGKTERCLSQGITLFHIWESDWHGSKDEMKLFILSLFKR